MRFVNRANWGARPPRNRSGIGDVRGVTLHWGGGHLGNHSHGRCYQIIRSWQNYHMDTNGWSDLGYNAVACIHGYVFEGRGVGIRGAHAGASNIGGNDDWYGLCAMVGPGDTITDDLLDALRDGIAWFRDHGAGDRVNGHRDHHATECPGDVLYRWTRGGDVGGGSSAGGGRLLSRGDSGPAVRQWQDDLIAWDPDSLPVYGADGHFGEETEDWTHRFQRLAGITSDGIVGPQTRQAMEEELDMPSKEEYRDSVLHDQAIKFNKGTKNEGDKSLAGYLQHLEQEQDTTQNLIRAQNTTIDKLVDMLEAFSGGTDFDPEALKREIREAIESVTVRLDVPEDKSA